MIGCHSEACMARQILHGLEHFCVVCAHDHQKVQIVQSVLHPDPLCECFVFVRGTDPTCRSACRVLRLRSWCQSCVSFHVSTASFQCKHLVFVRGTNPACRSTCQLRASHFECTSFEEPIPRVVLRVGVDCEHFECKCSVRSTDPVCRSVCSTRRTVGEGKAMSTAQCVTKSCFKQN